MYKVGDIVQVKEGDGSTFDGEVVKVCDEPDINNESVYLLHNNNKFLYVTESRMISMKNGNIRKKRKKDDESICSAGYTTASKLFKKLNPLATYWYDTNQLQSYNVQFIANLPGKHGFDNFFEGNKVDINQSAREIMQLHWDTEAPKELNMTQQTLINLAFAFQCSQSESTVERFATKIFELFNIRATTGKTTTIFGQADMLGTNAEYGLVTGVVENKCGGAYTDTEMSTRRCQLAAYMISTAIHNAMILKNYGKVFDEQTILGILHYGLTPIFYKMNASREYLEAIEYLYDNSIEPIRAIPTLTIREYIPATYPICDRMILLQKPRETIFNSYESFKILLQKYSDKNVSCITA